MSIIRPPVTGDPVLDSWTNQATNLLRSYGLGSQATGGSTSETFTGFTSVITGVNSVASKNEHVHVTTSGVTITLPSVATGGDRIMITVGNFVDTTVARNGLRIMGLEEDLIIDVANLGLTFIYTDATYGWRIA